MSFNFAFLRTSVAIRRCPPECPLIVAHARMPSLVNAPMCTIAFTAVSYERVRTRFRTRKSDDALTSMSHILRVGNLFLHHFTLTVHGCNRNQPNVSFIAM